MKRKCQESPRNSVKDHVFPFGVKVKKIKTSSFSCAEEIMFNMKYAELNKNCFIFPLLSEETHDQIKKLDDIIEASNPSRLLYFVCIKTEDFFKTESSNTPRKSKEIWVVEKAYCFMTYYPFMPFFFEVLIKFLTCVKLTRMETIADNQIRDNLTYENIDSHFALGISKKFEKNLQEILNSSIPKFGKMISIDLALDEANGIKEALELRMEDQSKAYTIEAAWAAPFVFSYFSLKDIIFLFTAVMLEKKSCFVIERAVFGYRNFVGAVFAIEAV